MLDLQGQGQDLQKHQNMLGSEFKAPSNYIQSNLTNRPIEYAVITIFLSSQTRG